MAALLQGAGLSDVHTRAKPLDAVFDPTAALALRTGAGSLGWRFARLGRSAQDAVRQRAAGRLAGLPKEDFIDRSVVLLATARRR